MTLEATAPPRGCDEFPDWNTRENIIVISHGLVNNRCAKINQNEERASTNHTTPANAQDYIGKIVTVTMDRQLGTKHPKHRFEYPVNYGYIADTISGDGEELDAYVLNVREPLETFTGTCVAVIHRTNNNDDKLVVVAPGTSITDEEINAQTYFQEQWFESVIREQ